MELCQVIKALICFEQLQAVSWRLNLQMAQSNATKMKLPNAMMELSIASGRQVRTRLVSYSPKGDLYVLFKINK